MSETYKLKYANDTLTHDVNTAILPIALTIPDYPTGTYTRTLFFDPNAAESGKFIDSIYNYDLLRITTMPQDTATNPLAAPNSPYYIEPEWLKNNTVHTQTFGFDNASTITTNGYFIWGDNGLSASPDGMSFLAYKHGEHFRIGGTHWNTTDIPADGSTATYNNYYKPIYQIDGIIYNGNREILYSGTNSVVTANLTKSITGNDYKYIQVKVSDSNTTDYDGMYISQLNSNHSNTRDSISFPYGGNGNWYCGGARYAWSNNYKTLTCTGAKAFMKSLTSNASMTGNTATPRSNIFAIWGVK